MLRYFNTLSATIMVLSFLGTLYGMQTCSGDGCMVRIVAVVSVPCLVVSVPVFLYTRKKLKN